MVTALTVQAAILVAVLADIAQHPHKCWMVNVPPLCCWLSRVSLTIETYTT
jgi:hypothetical protein